MCFQSVNIQLGSTNFIIREGIFIPYGYGQHSSGSQVVCEGLAPRRSLASRAVDLGLLLLPIILNLSIRLHASEGICVPGKTCCLRGDD